MHASVVFRYRYGMPALGYERVSRIIMEYSLGNNIEPVPARSPRPNWTWHDSDSFLGAEMN